MKEEVQKLKFNPLSDYSIPQGQDPFLDEFIHPELPRELDLIESMRQNYEEFKTSDFRTDHSIQSDIGEARVVALLACFGRLLARGLVPTGLYDVTELRKRYGDFFQSIYETNNIDELVAIFTFSNSRASVAYPIENKRWFKCSVSPIADLERVEPHIKYEDSDNVIDFVTGAWIYETPTTFVLPLQSLGRPLSRGLAQFEMANFMLLTELNFIPQSFPELIDSKSLNASYADSNNLVDVELLLSEENCSLVIKNFNKAQLKECKISIAKSSFLKITDSDGDLTFTLPQKKPDKEQPSGGRNIDFGTQSLVRIGQIINHLKYIRQRP